MILPVLQPDILLVGRLGNLQPREYLLANSGIASQGRPNHVGLVDLEQLLFPVIEIHAGFREVFLFVD